MMFVFNPVVLTLVYDDVIGFFWIIAISLWQLKRTWTMAMFNGLTISTWVIFCCYVDIAKEGHHF
jgi:uncharacterized membrane protein